MTDRVTPEFYGSEAERLLQLACATTDRPARIRLLEMAARYREIAAELHGKHAPAANSNRDPATKSA